MNARITIIVAITDFNKSDLAHAIVGRLFPEYTVTWGAGEWEGTREQVLIYTIFDRFSDGLKRHAELTAKALAVELNEQAVLLHIEMVNPPVLVGPNGVL